MRQIIIIIITTITVLKVLNFPLPRPPCVNASVVKRNDHVTIVSDPKTTEVDQTGSTP